MRRRRGFTLAELAVYMGLVATGVMVFAGIELSAQRSIAIQGTLLDMSTQANTYLGALRRDVEAARSVRIQADGRELLVQRPDGSTVLYRAGLRIELGADGKQRARERYRLLIELRIRRPSPSGPQLIAEARFARGEVERTFRRSAAQRRGAP
jgi:hypothetical protein